MNLSSVLSWYPGSQVNGKVRHSNEHLQFAFYDICDFYWQAHEFISRIDAFVQCEVNDESAFGCTWTVLRWEWKEKLPEKLKPFDSRQIHLVIRFAGFYIAKWCAIFLPVLIDISTMHRFGQFVLSNCIVNILPLLKKKKKKMERIMEGKCEGNETIALCYCNNVMI